MLVLTVLSVVHTVLWEFGDEVFWTSIEDLIWKSPCQQEALCFTWHLGWHSVLVLLFLGPEMLNLAVWLNLVAGY